jgi:hypothetical protein
MRLARGAAAALALGVLLWLAACGGGDGDRDETSVITVPPGVEQTVPDAGGEAVEEAGGSDEAAEAERASEGYVRAIDARDASGVCASLAPGALVGVRGASGPCEQALGAALGRRPAGGGPAWKRTEIRGPTKVAIADQRARVTLEVLHRFADRRYPSLEDDVIYLERSGDRWLVVKPSATLYRAIGYPEPPLRAFAPPQGWPSVS